jgi:hypothetical protein
VFQKELGMSLLKVLNRINQLFIFSKPIDRHNLFECLALDVKSLVENSDPLIVIARLIKGNNSDILGKSLNGLKNTVLTK